MNSVTNEKDHFGIPLPSQTVGLVHLGEGHVTLPVYETDAVSAHMEKSAKQRAQQKKQNCIHDEGAVAGLDINWKIRVCEWFGMIAN